MFACVRACVRACVLACVRVCVCACARERCTTCLQMDCYGVMKAKSSSVQVMVQGFLTGMPECNMIINDTKMIDHRRRTTRGALTMPPHQATIRMCGVQLHPSVNQDAFKNDLQIRFQCMEGVRYEALRFKVRMGL